MGRIFILVVILCNNFLFSQNLLLNGDFEEISDSSRKVNLYKYRFYFKNWHEPTDCSSDIFRDTSICDYKHTKSIEPLLDFCIDVQSGAYSAGLGLINYKGDTEYLTGKLKTELKKDSLYKISYWVKFAPNKFMVASKGLGYKLSNDSIVFKSNIFSLDGLESNYVSLFNSYGIFADYYNENLFINTKWTKQESIFKAKGGEKFITFGMFKLKNDKEIIKQFNKLKGPMTQEKLYTFLSQNKSLILEKVTIPKNEIFENLDENYYFLDNISVDPLKLSEIESVSRSCINCIDNKPLTVNIPNELKFYVDKGYFGDLDLSIHVFLSAMEKAIVDFGNKDRIEFINTSSQDQEFNYSYKYPAKKVRGKNIVYKIETTTLSSKLKYSSYLSNNPAIRISSNVKIYK